VDKIPNSVIIKSSQVVIDSAVRVIETPTLCILGSRCDCRYNHDGCATQPAPEHLPCMGTVCGRYEQRRAV
jgi:hypothetical protein